YEGDNIGQGRDNTITWLEQNPGPKDEIEIKVRQKLSEASDSLRPVAAAAARLAAGTSSAGAEAESDAAVASAS
ncbi:MAG: DNA recombination/repair protein RecA, partial [Vulcanococcus sp.]